MRPPATGWKPEMHSMRVVLPAPLGPMRPTISPLRASSSTSSRAWRPPKRTATCLQPRTTGASARSSPPSPVRPGLEEEVVDLVPGRAAGAVLLPVDLALLPAPVLLDPDLVGRSHGGTELGIVGVLGVVVAGGGQPLDLQAGELPLHEGEVG